MRKYNLKRIGEVHVSNEGYEIEIVGGGLKTLHCKCMVDGRYEIEAQYWHVVSGRVKNKLHPSVCGVGCVGVGEYAAGVNGNDAHAYKVWHSMLVRCYSSKAQKKSPTYIGCTVCERWLNYQNFAEWFDINYIDGYQLDKDIKFNGNKIYSPETCMFVTPLDNSLEAHAKRFSFLSPECVRVDVYNLSKFCRENNLSDSHMNSVFTGKRKQHKGWSKL